MTGHTKGQGAGWIEFAGICFLVASAFNFIAGITGLLKHEFFDESKVILASIQDWSILWLVLAAVQLVAGIAVLMRLRAARVPAIILAVIGLVVWFVIWSVSPFWGLAMMIVYGVIIYGLTAYREYFA
jgi:hypothetical protein